MAEPTISGVASSLAVIEEFYGEPLSKDLISTVQQTPIEQLMELARRLSIYQSRVETVLTNRIYKPADRTRITQAQGISLRYDPFSATNVVAHDSMLVHGGRDRAITEMDELKHLLLYADRLVLPDYALVWAYDLHHRDGLVPANDSSIRILARALQDLIPLASLVRSGDILLIPPPEVLQLGESHSDAVMLVRDLTQLEAYQRDPYMTQLAIKDLGIPDRETLDYYGVEESDLAGILNVWFELIGRVGFHYLSYRIEEASGIGYPIEDILAFSYITRQAAILPITSDSRTWEHLANCSRVLLSGGARTCAIEGKPSYEAAIHYRVPAMSNVSLNDLINLRQNEDVFHTLRRCLIKVSDQVATVEHANGYHSFSASVAGLADDIIRPAYEELERARRRASVRSKIWDYASGGVISLGVSALGALVGTPGAADAVIKGLSERGT
jgi:hypothetical protein